MNKFLNCLQTPYFPPEHPLLVIIGLNYALIQYERMIKADYERSRLYCTSLDLVCR